MRRSTRSWGREARAGKASARWWIQSGAAGITRSPVSENGPWARLPHFNSICNGHVKCLLFWLPIRRPIGTQKRYTARRWISCCRVGLKS